MKHSVDVSYEVRHDIACLDLTAAQREAPFGGVPNLGGEIP
jgi:hypothetical protein